MNDEGDISKVVRLTHEISRTTSGNARIYLFSSLPATVHECFFKRKQPKRPIGVFRSSPDQYTWIFRIESWVFRRSAMIASILSDGPWLVDSCPDTPSRVKLLCLHSCTTWTKWFFFFFSLVRCTVGWTSALCICRKILCLWEPNVSWWSLL